MSQLYYQGADGNFYPQVRNTSNNFQKQNPFVARPTTTPALSQYKRSGAVYSKIKKGNFEGHTIVNAWRVTKNGLMQATVSPYKGSDGNGLDVVHSHGKSGTQDIEYQKMICVIRNASMGTSQTFHVLMNLKTKVISISELSLCITPNGNGVTRSGKRVSGYFGRNFKK
jgi:hypothetical protein